MPERAFAVDAPDGREAQVTETGNQPPAATFASDRCRRELVDSVARANARAVTRVMLSPSRAPGPQTARCKLPPTTAARAGART